MDIAGKLSRPCIQTQIVRGANLVGYAVHEGLVATLAMAKVHPGLTAATASHFVQALAVRIAHCPRVFDMCFATTVMSSEGKQ